jgi:RNA polymerase sigma-70 factor, ECF subfamily
MLPSENDSTAIGRGAMDMAKPASLAVPETSVESLDEAALVSQLAAFDPEAWRAVFDRYFTSIFRLAYVRTRHHGAAEDIAAQTFAEAAEGIGRYRYRGVPFRAWLYRIARNLTSDHLKAQRRQLQVTLEETSAVDADSTLEPETNVDFVAAIDDLTDDQKTVVLMRLVDGYSLAEVAEAMGKSTGAIKQLQHRALVTLQQRMSTDQLGGGVKR